MCACVLRVHSQIREFSTTDAAFFEMLVIVKRRRSKAHGGIIGRLSVWESSDGAKVSRSASTGKPYQLPDREYIKSVS